MITNITGLSLTLELINKQNELRKTKDINQKINLRKEIEILRKRKKIFDRFENTYFMPSRILGI